MLARRLVPALLVLAVAFAPAALDACQAMCEVHEAEGAAVHGDHHGGHNEAAPAPGNPSGHSCAHTAAVDDTDGPALTSGPHACGHTDDLPLTAGITQQVALATPGVVPVAYRLTPPAPIAAAALPRVHARDSVPIALTLPLRV